MTQTDRPGIRTGFRLQYEPAQNAYVLLYPEGMVKLNTTAAEILRRCDGLKTIDEIVQELESVFQREGLTSDVTKFLDIAANQGWVSKAGA